MSYTENVSYGTPSVRPRFLMYGAQMPAIFHLIGHTGLNWPLKRAFLQDAMRDELFGDLLRAGLMAALGRAPRLDELHGRFGTGEKPDKYSLSHMIKRFGLLKSLEHSEIRELFLQYGPRNMVEDPRMKLILDGRCLHAALADPKLAGSAKAFWDFASNRFDLNAFLDNSNNRMIFKESSNRERIRFYEGMLSRMHAELYSYRSTGSKQDKLF